MLKWHHNNSIGCIFVNIYTTCDAIQWYIIKEEAASSNFFFLFWNKIYLRQISLIWLTINNT